MQIGAQFYTIRDFCKTPEDLALSLKKVADIGYKTVLFHQGSDDCCSRQIKHP